MIVGAQAWAHAVIAGAPTSAHGVAVQAPPPQQPAGQGEEFGKTSPIALVVILLLGIATALLIRSMNKRLRNVPASFDDRPDGHGDDADDDGSGSGGGATGGGATGAGDDPPRVGSP